jgi:recombination protein RecA
MTKKTKAEEKQHQDSLDSVISSIREKFGDGAIMKLGEATRVDVESIPTGSLALDIALGTGGLPKGRIIEIYGPESSGKTTLSLHVVREAQKKGGRVAFIDAEHALDPEYAKVIGVDVNDLLISQPDSGEEALNILETLVRSSGIDVVVVDSVAALVPRAEIEGEMGASHMGLQARLMSQALRKLTAICAKSGTMVIFINQLRMKIGVVFGNPETTPGGNALKFYSSVRLDVRRKAQIKKGEEIIGNRVAVKVVKNKVAPPFRIAEFDLLFGQGISFEGDVLNTGTLLGVIQRTGNSYIFEGEKIGVGVEAAKAHLVEDKKLLNDIVKAVRAKAKEGAAPVATKRQEEE